jgi:hypothetical protein
MREHTGKTTVEVGQELRVNWSNGAGYSIYRVTDDPGPGQHQLTERRDFEYVGRDRVIESIP